MNVIEPHRGRAAVPVRRPLDRPNRGWPDRVAARQFHILLDRIDMGLERGSLLAILPDGGRRLRGGRAAGPECEVPLPRWRAMLPWIVMVEGGDMAKEGGQGGVNRGLYGGWGGLDGTVEIGRDVVRKTGSRNG